MGAATAFVVGVFLIWVVANGRARAVWEAATGATTSTPGIEPGAPIPGGTTPPYTPPRTA